MGSACEGLSDTFADHESRGVAFTPTKERKPCGQTGQHTSQQR
jgi:hypothetical protein